MKPTWFDTLRMPGASLYYTVRGSGPLLLLLTGGAGDAESFNRVADYLVERYTVVTYDRRGLTRSPLDNLDQAIEIGTHRDDAHRLFAALTTTPAFVFGSSIGALIALDLAIHHPAQARLVVAHEPPIWQLLSETERPAVNIKALARREGEAAAIRAFAASIGVLYEDSGPSGGPRTERGRSDEDSAFFLGRDLGAVRRYRLDIGALQAIPTRIVLAGGQDGRAHFPYLCASRLAELIGAPLVEFPGHHAGYVTQPRAFAERLRDVLETAS
jgi:pimeloyl-ACP methyl ester carboxylesterase